MNLVYPILPRAGLGNMLLIWARAAVFAQINNLPMVTPVWTKLRLGPYLRSERDKRNYQSFFTRDRCISRWECLPQLVLFKGRCVHNPSLRKLDCQQIEKKNYSYIFEGVPTWDTCFTEILKYQPIVKERLFSMLSPSVRIELEKQPAPIIGVHVRMGDFKQQEPGQELTKASVHTRTSLEWYIKTINIIREIAGYDLPITVFSDGQESELSKILSLSKVTRAKSRSAIVDLLTLSRSKLLITSSRSTFSAWSSYLSDGSTIWHPAHFESRFGKFHQYKSSASSRELFEGVIDPYKVSAQLKQSILDII